MDLYKVEGVNPLGGCLPILLKIPFFLALFWTLQSKEFTLLVGQGAVFIPGWIVDIAKHDPFFVLPALIGVSTWLSQKSMPSAPGQSQAMLWFMPIFITFISYNFAAGVQLYWVISNLMGWAQQTYIMSQKIPKKA
jgi:YidC/Oxa1 family membrane protein insertase